MKPYWLCDFVIASNAPLPELARAEQNQKPEFIFHLHIARQPQKRDVAIWFNEWRYPDEEPWLYFAHTPEGYLFRFPDLADFQVSENGKHISCHPVPEIPAHTINHIFLNQIMPIILSGKAGRLALHASAVVIEDVGVAFLGMTGKGKSTLAGNFCGQGFPLLTDDFLVVEERNKQLFGLPSYPSLRLWEDVLPAVCEMESSLSQVAHYTEKKRLSIGDSRMPFSAQPAPLKHLYVLTGPEENNDENEVAIEPLSPRDALIEVTKYAFHLDLNDAEQRRSEFVKIGRIVELVKCFRLSYPQDLDLLPKVRQAILDNVKSVSF
jgi:hypothetical protein